MAALASKLAQLQSKACEATRFAAKHGCAYHKTLMEKNKHYVADPPTLSHLEQNGQVVFRYSDPDGRVLPAANPNGSQHNVAGVVNREGNVLGMMPHPERCADPALGGEDGLLLFRSVVAAGLVEVR